MEYVSVEQFRDFFHLTEEEVSDSFLKGYIKDRNIMLSDLTRRDWGAVAKTLFAKGVTYGHNITTIISRNYRFARPEEDFGKVTHVIVQMEIFKKNGLSEPRYFVIDREDNKLFYSDKEIRLDYTKAEISVSMSNDEVRVLLNKLREIITPQWEISYGLGDHAEYHWDLFMILSEGDMIRYEGEGRDEKYRPGFDKWCQHLYEEISNA